MWDQRASCHHSGTEIVLLGHKNTKKCQSVARNQNSLYTAVKGTVAHILPPILHHTGLLVVTWSAGHMTHMRLYIVFLFVFLPYSFIICLTLQCLRLKSPWVTSRSWKIRSFCLTQEWWVVSVSDSFVLSRAAQARFHSRTGLSGRSLVTWLIRMTDLFTNHNYRSSGLQVWLNGVVCV